jgi:hypothetical protein
VSSFKHQPLILGLTNASVSGYSSAGLVRVAFFISKHMICVH